MPRIEIYDATNTVFRIDTFDWDRIRAWLGEWIPILSPGHEYEEEMPLRIAVYPLFLKRTTNQVAEPDWNADTRFFTWFTAPWNPDQAIDAIKKQRELIERAKAEGKKFLDESTA